MNLWPPNTQFQDVTNPCIQAYGPGPIGAICKTCAFFERHGYSGRSWFKCGKRNKNTVDLNQLKSLPNNFLNTCGVATDHKTRWPACALYAPKTSQAEQEIASYPPAKLGERPL